MWLSQVEEFHRNYISFFEAYMGGSQNWGNLFRDPQNKDYSILGFILGYPNFGKLPCGMGMRLSIDV